MGIIALIVGIVLIAGTAGSLISSVLRTPGNLRGYYGGFYSLLSVFGFLGGVGLTIVSFML